MAHNVRPGVKRWRNGDRTPRPNLRLPQSRHKQFPTFDCTCPVLDLSNHKLTILRIAHTPAQKAALA